MHCAETTTAGRSHFFAFNSSIRWEFLSLKQRLGAPSPLGLPGNVEPLWAWKPVQLYFRKQRSISGRARFRKI